MAAALAAAGGGHPPAIILVPFIFGAWLIGSIAIEGLLLWRRRGSIRTAFVLIATAANLFVAGPATTLLIRELAADRHGSSGVAALVLFGPACLAVTCFTFFEIAHGRRLVPIIVLSSLSVAILWFAVRDGDPLFLNTAITIAVFQGTAALLLATDRGPRDLRPNAVGSTRS